MAITEVLVPQLSESISEATLLTWKKQPGEAVTADEILIEVETDKVVLEVPAPASGVLTEIVKADGSTVTAGEVLARIDTEAKAGAAAPAAAAAPAPAPAAASAPAAAPVAAAVSSVASPAAGKILADKGIDPASVEGSGRGGRITKGDALEAGSAPAKKAAAPVAPPTLSLDGRPEQRVPMSRLRARV
ncbi:MAG TPA: biotin/lipoyl-containing protein, partial [Eoetvoesiella sp.]|uniref:biotin/lipoyl-containing protein n=1 Tax=Eoetvoesiella sp. TaxID=1966355 RepID=UPI002CF4DB33